MKIMQQRSFKKIVCLLSKSVFDIPVSNTDMDFSGNFCDDKINVIQNVNTKVLLCRLQTDL